MKRALTLIELVLALAVTSLLIAGTAAALRISASAVELGYAPAASQNRSAEAVEQILSDAQNANAFALAGNTLTLSVPDRSSPADGTPETIRYSWSGTPGDPLIQTTNGTAVTLVEDVHHFHLTQTDSTIPASPPPTFSIDDSTWGYFLSRTSGYAGTILVVVQRTSSLTSHESDVIDSMLDWGYSVRIIADGASQATYDAQHDLIDAAYIVAGVDELSLGTKLRNAPVGVVVEPTYMSAEMGVGQSNIGLIASDTANVVDSNHYITRSLTGSVELAEDQYLSQYIGAMGEGQTLLALAHPVTVVLEAGDLLQDGDPAAGRRVFIGWGSEFFEHDELTDTGRLLTRRAIEWATGE
ncbi:PulJ/GspJ family protein [Mucisphaera sp.]|uniref:PulJ/GspJ family protein n=1 Tax=Mucisphaera sp. TaxID=2913024 RepID=UPI003D0DC93D